MYVCLFVDSWMVFLCFKLFLGIFLNFYVFFLGIYFFRECCEKESFYNDSF